MYIIYLKQPKLALLYQEKEYSKFSINKTKKLSKFNLKLPHYRTKKQRYKSLKIRYKNELIGLRTFFN